MSHPRFKPLLRFVLCFTLGVSSLARANPEADAKTPFTAIQNTSDLIKVLESTPTGAFLLQEARKAGYETGPQERDWLTLGTVSKTDAVITRTLNPDSGEEKLERRLLIQIRRNQGLLEGALNLAHELIHAIDGHQIDPYDSQLSLALYLKESIEGTGGEVYALATECRVSYEIRARFHWSQSRCERYEMTGHRVNLSKIREDFYRVGAQREWVVKNLRGDVTLFPQLSDQAPVLYSSTGQAPYPVALVREFENLTEVACRNSVERLHSLQANSKLARREIAQVSRKAQMQEKTLEFLAQRCPVRPPSL